MRATQGGRGGGSGDISRSTEQQVIATMAPAAVVLDVNGQSTQPFLTLPFGSFAAYLRRIVDNAGGLYGNACYVQVQQVGAGGLASRNTGPQSTAAETARLKVQTAA